MTLHTASEVISLARKLENESAKFYEDLAAGNKKDSDIDILVKFKESPSLLTIVKLENDLSEILGVKVDLVTTGALKNKRILKSIKKDLINIM